MSENKRAVSKTLLWSIIMSSPGPLVVGLGLITGKSSTQIVDFVRRTAEFIAIVMSYIVYTMVVKDDGCDDFRKRKLEHRANIFVGTMMSLAGAIMLALAFLFKNTDKGNVIPGLVIAVLSAIANSRFWIKYTRLRKSGYSAIMSAQARLYRAKTLVDSSVTVALLSIIIAPKSALAHWFDIGGSVVVSFYLFLSGIRTIQEVRRS